jgi:hypothetical protein
MSIRAVKQYSDRGSIKDLAANAKDPYVPEEAPKASELRMKKLLEYAQQDKKMQSALGIITIDYIADKNALPLSVYRLRKIVDDIKSKSSEPIDQFGQELSKIFGIEHTADSDAYWNNRKMVKSASVRKPPVFRRVK